ncbi:hypothetical protein D3C87_1084650 [compost metagenome]|uniref:Surface antigen domain-containing protein n=1 Tax=Cupriavidus campinensis TaxID=151783 RepID=A0AAE9L1D8_9BURK|nr:MULTISPECIES: hypothetical protein [Cupriavidus]URF03521.1 hypothetical protein M5D45_13470 [Cupriavidus campinensis]CAG2149389.1 hypothetical protein LMG19282_03553 [Cupriavidus campinensis]
MSRRLAVNLRACVCLAMCAVAWPAQAYFDHFLNNTIVGRLSRPQTETLAAIYRTALSEKDDGSTTPFQLEADKDAKAAEGSMTLVKTTQKGDQRCRQVKSEFRQAGKTEKWTGWYCRKGDGDWRRTQMKE